MCPKSAPAQLQYSSGPNLAYELCPGYDVEAFLARMKGRHLEDFEKIRDISKKILVQQRSAYEPDKDVWEVQRLI